MRSRAVVARLVAIGLLAALAPAPARAAGCEAVSPSGTFRAVVPPEGGVVRVRADGSPDAIEIALDGASPAHVRVDDGGRYVLAVEAAARPAGGPCLFLFDARQQSVRGYRLDDVLRGRERRLARDVPELGLVWQEGGHFLVPGGTTFFLVTVAGLKALEATTGTLRPATGAEAAAALRHPIETRGRLAAIRRARDEGLEREIAGELDLLLDRLTDRPYEEPAHAEVFATFLDVFGPDRRLREPRRVRRLLDVYLAYDRWRIRRLFDDHVAAEAALVRVLADPREPGPVRCAAASCLLAMGESEDEAFALLLARLDDPDAKTREEAELGIWYAPYAVWRRKDALEERIVACLAGPHGDRARDLVERSLREPRVREFGEALACNHLGRRETSPRVREALLRALATPHDAPDDADRVAAAILAHLDAREPAVAGSALLACRELARELAAADGTEPPALEDAAAARRWLGKRR